jgi:hypothetical protein
MDRFYIGPQTGGLQRNVKSFAIPEDAFSVLNNVYLHRGSIRKRFGTQYMRPEASSPVPGYESLLSRLRIQIGVTNALGTFVGAVPTAAPDRIIGQQFSIGFSLFTVTGPLNLLRSDGIAAVATFDFATGNVIIQGSAPFAPVYYYPSFPVMGILVNETKAVNFEVTYFFDTRFAYHWTVNSFERLGNAVWSGTDSDFFWGNTHRGATSDDDILFVTNNVDPIAYWDGAAWVNLTPLLTAGGTVLQTARILMSFKNRLLAFNTTESGVLKQNRCRFSQNGTPLITADIDAWREDIVGKGGFIDLPTQENIITAQHLRDRLIVFCERSTWELCYTGNQVLPFVWQQINTELGCESTFSEIPFDQVVLGVGNVGIHACDGSSVIRIDEKIPDEVFNIHNEDDGPRRVVGVRDYFLDHVYWAFPSTDGDKTFKKWPDKVLAHNYNDKTWALFDDSFTVFGYDQRGQSLPTWSSLVAPLTWDTWLEPWGDRTPEAKPRYRNILAGNQQGFVLIVMASSTVNQAALQVTELTSGDTLIPIVCINHNLKKGDYVLFSNYVGLTIQNYDGTPTNEGIIVLVDSVTSMNELVLRFPGAVVGAYQGGGLLARVSRIQAVTKQFNFYVDKALSFSMEKINFNFDRTANGKIAIAFSTNSSNQLLSMDGQANNALLGIPIIETSAYALEPLEQTQKQVNRPYYLQARGDSIQVALYLDNDLMIDQAVMRSDFQWNSTVYYCSPTGEI